MHQLTRVLNEVTFRNCQAFINRVRKARHKSILECQIAKGNRLRYKTTTEISGNVSWDMYISNSGSSKHTASGSSTTTSTPVTSAAKISTTSMCQALPAQDTTKAKQVKMLSTKLLKEAQISLLAWCQFCAIVSVYSPKESTSWQWRKLALNSPQCGGGTWGRNQLSA